MTSRISVFGLGYVGCVSAACFAKEGHQVVGVDVNPSKVDMINNGIATIVEHGIGDLVAEMRASGRMRATVDVREAVLATDISLVCVGTPSKPNGALELGYVERVCEQIGAALKEKTTRHTIIIRSTVLPGSTHGVAIPALERYSGLKANVDFGIGMNPEFLREGTSIEDFYDPPFTVVGSEDPRTVEAVQAIYAGIDAPFHAVATGVAEMLKYACNCYHGLKVSFANEIGNVAKALGVDSHEVMRLFCLDTKLNVSPAYLKPGFAFGGSCLPKDLRGLAYRARTLDIETPVLSGTLASNQLQIMRAFELVAATGRKRVGVLGLAFKSGTDDLRESPMVTLIEKLLGRGFEVTIYDKEVRSANIIGSNRDYVEQEVPHIWELMRASVDEVLADADVIVIGNGSKEFKAIEPTLRPGQRVVDLVRVFGPKVSDGSSYEGICW
ncbi:MAG: UDP-glucose/GDP-mannose dehydrogenase family protein [Gemmatimonadaceae bacterium]|nr:UDP-glucose/GDP-mannose dehydrogenase family protein [Gemmatimonadaceae bacterium]